MKFIYPAILGGAALVGLAVLIPSLAGKGPLVHRLMVPLPDGGTEMITYSGDAAPKVTFHPDSFDFDWPTGPAFGFLPSFVALDRVAASMDRDMGDFLRQAETLERLPAGPTMTTSPSRTIPAGDASYSQISEMIGDGTCTRMVQVTQRAPGEKPEVMSRVSGNCDAGNAPVPEPNPAGLKAIKAQMTAAPAASRTAL